MRPPEKPVRYERATVPTMLQDVSELGVAFGLIGTVEFAMNCLKNADAIPREIRIETVKRIRQAFESGSYNCVLWDTDLISLAREGCDSFIGQTLEGYHNPVVEGKIITLYYPDRDMVLGDKDRIMPGLSVYDGKWNIWAYAFVGLPDLSLMFAILTRLNGAAIGTRLSDNYALVFSGHIIPGSIITTATSVPVAWTEFMRQPFIGVEPHTIHRNDRRRMEKAGKCIPTVSTLVLRRTARETAEGESGGREYQCQWFRRGHWRRLPVPRKKDGKQTTWVRQALCGTPGKPLVVSHKVTAAIR